MQLPIYTVKGNKTRRKAELNDNVFAVEPNSTLIYEDVRRILGSKRQGTAKTKERAEVRGGGRKAYRQKGTGMARRGTMRSPLLKGGGTVFGPKPRSYGFRLNKNMRAQARRSALSHMVAQEAFTIVEDFKYDEPKTRNIVQILENFKMYGESVNILCKEYDTNLIKSVKNIPKVTVLPAEQANTFYILQPKHLLVMEGAVELLQTGSEKSLEEITKA